jgi:hypothetical protein
VSVKTRLAKEAQDGYGLSRPFLVAGAPTSGAGGTLAAKAQVGSLLVDTAAGKLHICTAVGGGSVTWTLVGSQV